MISLGGPQPCGDVSDFGCTKSTISRLLKKYQKQVNILIDIISSLSYPILRIHNSYLKLFSGHVKDRRYNVGPRQPSQESAAHSYKNRSGNRNT